MKLGKGQKILPQARGGKMRNVAVIGVGMTKHRSKRRDVNIAELVAEAVFDLFERFPQIPPQEIEAVCFGCMHTFEGVNQPELWSGGYIAGDMKSFLRIATGGTTGMTTLHGAYYYIASGLYDLVLAISYEKQSDGNTQLGLAHIVIPEGMSMMQFGPSTGMRGAATGGSTGGASFQAQRYCYLSGATEEHLAMHVVKNRRNAAKNPYAHLRMPDLTIEDVINTPMISYPLRYGHTCPTSDGACAMVLASEELAKKYCDKPAWVVGVASCATDPTFNPLGPVYTDPAEQIACKLAAKWAYEQAGISDPKKEIDYAEVYDAFAHQEMMWSERLGLFDEGKGPEMLEKGVTQMDGELPINASGGVISTNAIGCTAMVRVAECALQIMEQAGEHQVSKRVKNAVAHGWGGLFQFVSVTVLSESPKKS